MNLLFFFYLTWTGKHWTSVVFLSYLCKINREEQELGKREQCAAMFSSFMQIIFIQLQAIKKHMHVHNFFADQFSLPVRDWLIYQVDILVNIDLSQIYHYRHKWLLIGNDKLQYRNVKDMMCGNLETVLLLHSLSTSKHQHAFLSTVKCFPQCMFWS